MKARLDFGAAGPAAYRGMLGLDKVTGHSPETFETRCIAHRDAFLEDRDQP